MIIALPYRCDNPDLNDTIDTYNAFLNLKADTIPQVKLVDTSLGQQGRNVLLHEIKLHLKKTREIFVSLYSSLVQSQLPSSRQVNKQPQPFLSEAEK